MNKDTLLVAAREGLRQRIEESKVQLAQILRRANEAPGAMESHSDTDKNLYGRQAGGQQEAIGAMEIEYTLMETLVFPESAVAGVGSLVTTKDEKGESRYFILPGGGGIKLRENDVEVIVVTPSTPLGLILLGKKAGEVVAVGSRILTIVEIA
ncbi:MAG: hypothetical protein KBD16_01325 [Candidatus Pacebacteria bacterium]|nr:hypothetical protein [Candidatus Paceibacterota bacterium]